MNRQRVWALMRKDWLELAHNRAALAPIFILPVLFVVVLPTAIILLGGNAAVLASINGLQQFLDNLPMDIVAADFTDQQAVVYAVIVYFFAPIFLIIPVMIATVTASSSFVGEKERRTLEGLLYSPLTDKELVLGKVLVSLIPAVLLTWVAFLIYTILVNALGFSVFGGLFFPTGTWGVSMLLLVPLISFLIVSLMVAVSQRSTTMQSAQGTSVFVVLPIVGLIISQAAGLMLFNVVVVLIAAVVVATLDIVLFFVTVRSFKREKIITRL
jgi:ABC-type transport system involved in multi-copper enzyme maturation permease subunit